MSRPGTTILEQVTAILLIAFWLVRIRDCRFCRLRIRHVRYSKPLPTLAPTAASFIGIAR